MIFHKFMRETEGHRPFTVSAYHLWNAPGGKTRKSECVSSFLGPFI